MYLLVWSVRDCGHLFKKAVSAFSLLPKKSLPSKSKATRSASSVGVRDIQTPSVVRIADPANEVSTRWFRVKLLPTDCSPDRTVK